jgi:predicted outer membrane repeat protein
LSFVVRVVKMAPSLLQRIAMNCRCARETSVDHLALSAGLARFELDRLEPRQLFASFVVTTVADIGAGSLRQAILDSNAVTGTGTDTITFSSLFDTPRTISLASSLPQISSPLSVVGPGSSLLTVRLNALSTTIGGVFSSATTLLAMSGMTITGANISGNGAGLQSTGPGGPNITLDDCVFTGNTSAGLGGAIFLNNNSTLTIRNSTISNNQALSAGGICFFSNGSLVMENCTVANNITTTTTSGGGGGLYFFGTALPTVPAEFTPGTLIVRGSTFNNNMSARVGGGIMVETLIGTLLVQNSTISGNTAATSGGGIGAAGSSGTVRVQNSTIAGNTANGATSTTGGGGIYRASTMNNAIELTNTIVSGNINAANFGAPDIRVDMFTTTTANFCAIGNATGFTLAAGSGNNLAYGANLILGALANNGGPTQTRAIFAGSPLINAGSAAITPAALTTDQRGAGFARNVGGQVDIGAFERAASNAPAVISHAFLFETAPQRIRYQFDSNVGASFTNGDILLQNLSTGNTLPTSNVSFAYDTSTNTGTFTIIVPATGVLPKALYRATLLAAGVTDGSGVHLAADDVLDFHVLPGDATRDRSVGFPDLIILSQNYNLTGRTFSQGNFDYSPDGKVDFGDLVILAQNYNTSLAQASPIVMSALSERSRRGKRGVREVLN